MREKRSKAGDGRHAIREITGRLNISYKHEENSFNEFNREPLMPHMVSREGPALAVGDVNGDGLEDFFVGGAKRQPGSLFIQQRNGTFKRRVLPRFRRISFTKTWTRIWWILPVTASWICSW